MQSKRVVVIGAGMGGLSAALKLALNGLDVTVVERGDRPGGKLREQFAGDRRFYVGPTVLTMPWVFEDIFGEAGADLYERVRLHPIDTLARHAWSRDERLDLYSDHERSAEAIAAFAGPVEADGFRRFARDAARVHRALEGPFMRSHQPTPLSIFARFGWRGLGELTRIKAVLTLWTALGGYFKDPRLRQLFARYSTYVGASPYLAPATLMLVADVESSGVYAVDGGIHNLPEALAAVARERGVKIRFGETVSEIQVEHRRASAVQLASGERLAADVVLYNGDVAALGAGYLGRDVARAVPKVPPRKRSHSVLTWSIVARPSGFPLQYHNVFFPEDSREEFASVFRDLRLPLDPSIYICALDRDAPTASAGTASERFMVLVNAPARGDSQTLPPEDIARCEQRVAASLEHCGLTFEDREEVALTTPAYFEQTYPASGGAVFGRVTHGLFGSFDRPGATSRVPGLYLAGGSVHPGAGIPMASISGRLAALQILEDLETRRPPRIAVSN